MMNLLERMKHYNFWVALTMAVIILLNTISKAFNIDIDDAIINDIIMAILGIMVVLGFVQKDGYDFVDTSKNEETKENESINEMTTTKESGNDIVKNNRDTNEIIDAEDIEEIDIDKIIQDLKNDITKK